MKDLLNFSFPAASTLDAVFPTFGTIPELLAEALERGFYNGNTPANKLFNNWFFGGLETTPGFKEGVDKEKAQKAMNYAVCLMRSFAPKHNDKEAVCSMIFSECLEIAPGKTERSKIEVETPTR